MHKHSDFVHLHLHTQYSLLDGACHVDKVIEKAKMFNMPSLAITDHGNMFGAIEFYKKAMDSGIKPIIGCEFYIASDSRLDKDPSKSQEAIRHLVILAMNEQGYKNLIKLVSIGFLDGFYYKPRIDKEVLSKYSEGLLGLSACLKGEVAYLCNLSRQDEAGKIVGQYQDIFGKDNFYLEIMDHGLIEQQKVNKTLIELSKNLAVPIVCTNDVHYLQKDHKEAHDILLCIQTQTTLDDSKRMRFSSDEFYFKSPDEMKALFKELPQAYRNTMEINNKCNLELEFNKTYLPDFTPPDGKTQKEYLRGLVYEGLKKKYSEITPAIKDRVEHELVVIGNSGYESYFLITRDFVSYAKSKSIPVGPGRGSAAGSVVSYALGITDLDPLKYDLLFERFLNPDRVSMPDIDIDFCYERRNEVIDYVVSKYGKENVAQIVTFGTMGAKAVIRDVARVMGIAYQEADKIAKLVPNDLNMTIDEALKQEPELRNLIKTSGTIKKLIDTAKVLEGLSRHASVHAAGVVISQKPLTDYVPLYKSSDNQITTGYSMEALEKVGLLKMDFLGLRTLTVIDTALGIIKTNKGKDIDLNKIPLDDKKTFEMLSNSESLGVFQLESSGMRDLLRKLKPEVFEDLIALLALFRPGPLGSGMVEDFIKRKHGKVSVKYDHPLLEPVLKNTYGVILYQEQVMRIVSVLAGFSLSQADLLRRAMGKKVPEIMEQQRQLFINGCSKNKISEAVAKKIFDNIEYFAGYGFNKSHSAAYAVISYRTAYLKASYPIEFMCALLTSERDNTDKISLYIKECERMGIKILPPDVNESFGNFTVSGENIRFGLSAIKNIGSAAVENIVKVRQKNGKFNSLVEFSKLTDTHSVNKKVLESLVKAGALDSFKLKRSQMFSVIEKLLNYTNDINRDKARGQLSFFDTMGGLNGFSSEMKLDIPDMQEWHESQLLSFEKEMLGFYVSNHPLASMERMLRIYSTTDIKSLKDIPNTQEICVGGIITRLKNRITKKSGEKMAIATLEDLTGECEVLIFPKTYSELSDNLKEDDIIFVCGRVDARDEQLKIIASNVMSLENIKARNTNSVIIDVKEHDLSESNIQVFKDILSRYPGSIGVRLFVRTNAGPRVEINIGSKFLITPQEQFFADVENCFGEGSVRVR